MPTRVNARGVSIRANQDALAANALEPLRQASGVWGWAANGDEPRERYRVLVIDDNPSIHEDVRKILTPVRFGDECLTELESELFGEPEALDLRVDFIIESAYQGCEARERVKESARAGCPFALALVDMRMPPGWDGVETIARLWEIDPLIQVVICTAYSDRSWDEIVQRLGCTDGLLILKKPFERIEVLQIVHAMTRKWTLHSLLNQRFEDLEALVEQRTKALREANASLREQIEERRQAQELLKHLATHDVLTTLPNRALLYDWIPGVLAGALRYGRLIGFLLLDLDHFKEVNDSKGHGAGDLLLKAVAEMLRSIVRESDLVVRLGGDEFVIVLDGLRSPEDAGGVAHEIIEALSRPFWIEDHEVHTSTSIGISLFPSDGASIEDLLKNSDVAMYHAKEAGRGTYRFFREAMNRPAMEKVALKTGLRRALARGEFELWYQPLLDLESVSVCGMEALLRWRHPEAGLLLPARFLTVAEECGLIVPIGKWVIETACSQARKWQDSGLGRLPIAVNISARQLLDDDFVETIRQAQIELGASAGQLDLEFAETTVMQDFDRIRVVLDELAGLGIRIVIDDFGTGYSSLNRLRSLPIHALKIDGHFIQHIADDPRDAAIVMAIVTMAHSLNIQVIAEGVETQEQLRLLRNMKWERWPTVKCDKVQGFLFSEPLPPHALEKYLERGGEQETVSLTGDARCIESHPSAPWT